MRHYPCPKNGFLRNDCLVHIGFLLLVLSCSSAGGLMVGGLVSNSSPRTGIKWRLRRNFSTERQPIIPPRTHWNIISPRLDVSHPDSDDSNTILPPRRRRHPYLEPQPKDDPIRPPNCGVVKPFFRHVLSSHEEDPTIAPVDVVVPCAFTSWHDLLFFQETRSHTLCGNVPSFVEFCFQHQSIATQWNQQYYHTNDVNPPPDDSNHDSPKNFRTNHDENGEPIILRRKGQGIDNDNDEEEEEEDLCMDHVPNLLQGGAATGPIVRTQAGQVVRQLAYYPNHLTALPRHSVSQEYRHDSLSWVTELQDTWLPCLQAEFSEFMTLTSRHEHEHKTDDEDANNTHDDELDHSLWQSLRTRKGKEWSEETGWAHVALVDNFQFQESTARRWFPETVRILWDVVGTHRRIGPRLVALARQKAHSGIPPHVDYMNWMLTLHIPILTISSEHSQDKNDHHHHPHNATITNTTIGTRTNAGMRVNGVAHEWIIGHPVVMDTTFPHETYNDSDQDVYLLMIDFWHPDLSLDELDALRCFFAANSGV